ncbi:putative endonuclease [Leucobacter exalbidus]|uniref:UPF0102 protein JOF28_000720 n=1 Tax=Leucobacter exalbidus TaxID=662960 RepID=A0A940T359_9MICO|nr:YraN family protein [Leucobacter exalbidus]MBP1325488.1 putative endonuclease [Leucobacter exalbidus]
MTQHLAGGQSRRPAASAAVPSASSAQPVAAPHSAPHSAPRSASHNRTVGARGEAIAAAYLEGLGYRILDRNWYSRYGELDLVAVDGETLVAVEVKTRTGLGYGHPLQAITDRKAARLRRLLVEWCRAHDGSDLTDTAATAGMGDRLALTGCPDLDGPLASDDRPVVGVRGDRPRRWWAQLRIDAIGIVLRDGYAPNIDHLQGIS